MHEGLNADTIYFHVVSASNVTGEGPESHEVPELPLHPNRDRHPVGFALDWDGEEGPTATLTVIESAAEFSYQLQITTDLGAGEWIDVGDPLTGTGGFLSVTIPIDPTAPHLFYRFALESDH